MPEVSLSGEARLWGPLIVQPQLEVNVIRFTHSVQQPSPWAQSNEEELGSPSRARAVPGSRDQQVSFLLG